jgi:hypothetical protein
MCCAPVWGGDCCLSGLGARPRLPQPSIPPPPGYKRNLDLTMHNTGTGLQRHGFCQAPHVTFRTRAHGDCGHMGDDWADSRLVVSISYVCPCDQALALAVIWTNGLWLTSHCTSVATLRVAQSGCTRFCQYLCCEGRIALKGTRQSWLQGPHCSAGECAQPARRETEPARVQRSSGALHRSRHFSGDSEGSSGNPFRHRVDFTEWRINSAVAERAQQIPKTA